MTSPAARAMRRPLAPGTKIGSGQIGGFAWDSDRRGIVFLTCGHVAPVEGAFIDLANQDLGVHLAAGKVYRTMPEHPAVEGPLDCAVLDPARDARLVFDVPNLGHAVLDVGDVRENVPVLMRPGDPSATRHPVVEGTVAKPPTRALKMENGEVYRGYFEINSNGGEFGESGDSGAVIFAADIDPVTKTRPAVGLYFGHDTKDHSIFRGFALPTIFEACGLASLRVEPLRCFFQSLFDADAARKTFDFLLLAANADTQLRPDVHAAEQAADGVGAHVGAFFAEIGMNILTALVNSDEFRAETIATLRPIALRLRETGAANVLSAAEIARIGKLAALLAGHAGCHAMEGVAARIGDSRGPEPVAAALNRWFSAGQRGVISNV